MYNVVITEPAEKDMGDAINYIADELRNRQAALDLLDKTRSAIENLSDMPRRYALVREENLAREGIRLITVKNYIIFYAVREETNTVVILRFLYVKRDWQHIL